ncbi:MAG: hypothetical protein ABL997_15285 [Planctomycetota bacterium]
MTTLGRSRNASLLACMLLAGCHSLTGLRVDQVVRSEDRTAVLLLWFQAPAYPMTGGDSPTVEAITSIVLYPIDVLMSTAVAIQAPFDEKLEVRYGPAGAVAGICLPWVTLVPFLYTPYYVLHPPAEVELPRSEFDRLLASVHRGDGLAAIRELVPSTPDVEDLYAVELLRVDTAGDEHGGKP